MATISDYKQQRMVKNFISDCGLSTNQKLKNVYLCGTGTIKPKGMVPAVFIMKDQNAEENKHKFFGQLTCRSAWACPTCTAKIMGKKGADIACLIDALAKRQKRYACMITFTIPHTEGMSCKQTFDLLLATWRKFARGNKTHTTKHYTLKNNLNEVSKKGGRKGVGEKGLKKTYQVGFNEYGNFREELNINHTIKVYEFTWGENSWHPHIHALFWIPEEKFDSATKYERSLAKRWWHCAKSTCLSLYGEKLTNKLFPDWKLQYHSGLYISKDKDNKPIKQSSSHYITGWTGDQELTKSCYKNARKNHYTPFNMLDLAQKATNPTEKNKWLALFIEYAMAVHKHRRVEFSKNTGESIKQLITNWKKSNDYVSYYKKKDTQQKMKMVYWFHEKQWLLISFLEKTTKQPIRATILEKSNNINQLNLYLLSLDPLLVNHDKYQNEEFIESLFKSAA